MRLPITAKVILLAGIIGLLLAGVSFAEDTYPQLDISGFKKWEHKEVKVDPERNYFSGLTHLGGYYPTFSGGPWQERLQLRIVGQLSENLSVGYDLEQQPETPEKYDVKVKYYNTELTFGDINANFSGNEFVSASKYLNGVMLTAKDSWYDIVTVPSAKLKSQTQSLTSQKGNNTKGPYNLGHGSIVEGSEQIQLNGIYLARNTDYTIDYFEGKITFNRILNQTDEFKYSYEYTNIMDLFFPSLSKRDFFGFQSRFTVDPEKFGKPEPKEEPVLTAARDVFPTQGSTEADVQERETSGQYQLKVNPIRQFSETLTFMGTQLKKNEDYMIRYDTGEIKLLTRFLPSSAEALTVEYSFYQTSDEVEAIPGIGSRGPYRTRYKHLVPESERVEVDSKLFVRDLDYTISNNAGELMFGVVIGPTSQIKISYRHNVMALPPAAPSKYPKELKLGATYLKESAKKGAGAPTASAIESYSGTNIISANYILNLSNRPILPTTEASLVVNLNGQPLTWEVDYVVPITQVDPATGFINVVPPVKLGYTTDKADPTDGYGTGTIYFLNQNIASSDVITVTYTYNKSIVGKYSGVGDGSRGPFYLRNIRDLVPGSETVQVWDQGSSVISTYTRNPSFDATAGNTGYSLNYNSTTPSITFNSELASTKNFQIIYQYVPPVSGGNEDIAQVAYGFDGSFKIGSIFRLDSAFAASETDQVYIAESTVESFAGNGTKTYLLHSTADLIEGSEKIYVNNQLLNKDIDYFATYTKPGQFSFYYITPGTQDAIAVEYKFQSMSGIVVGQDKKRDTAFRLGAETKLFNDTLTINGTTKKIGFNFAPLGGTAIGVGSEYQEYNANFNPAYQSFYSNYSYKFNKNPIGTTQTTFNRSYDHSFSTGLNPNSLAKLGLGFRYVASLDDPLSPGALHNNDNDQRSYSAGLVPSEWKKGVLTLNQNYNFSKTTSKADTVDQGANRSVTDIDYYHAGADLKFTDRLTLGYDWQYNDSLTLGSLETSTAHNRGLDSAYNLGLDLTMGFLQKWTARVSLLNHDDLKFVPTPETTVSTRNETYHMDVTPFTMLTGALDHNRQERTSYVTGGENPRTVRTSGNARLTPIAWFSTGLNASKSESIPETGITNRTFGRTYGYDADYVPLSFNALKLSMRFAGSDSYQVAPLGSEAVKTDTKTFAKSFNLNLNVIPILPLSFGYGLEDYNNKNNALTSPVTTETQNLTLTGSTSLTIPRLPQLTLSADYSKKVTKDLRAGIESPKDVLNGKASYQVLSWGTLIYDVTQERNLGEVQAGVVAGLNFYKKTETYSLNITIPVNNPVLSNFTVLASLKQVTYNNFKNGADDFQAQLLSFEGTMNF